MHNGHCQVDVSHSLTSHFGISDFDAAAVADNPFVFDFLVFSTRTLPIASRAEDLLAEESSLFGLESTIVNRFWFLDLTTRPLITDHIVRCDIDRKFVKLVRIVQN